MAILEESTVPAIEKQLPIEQNALVEASDKSVSSKAISDVDLKEKEPSTISSQVHLEQYEQMKTVVCSSKKLQLDYEVFVQNETVQDFHQRCFILTIHDVARTYTKFHEFVMSEDMCGIRNRTVWLHVTLPGQQMDAHELKVDKYPSMEELGEELVCVLESFKIPQVVCMGEGAGAYIAAQFAIKHPQRCLGLILIEPTLSAVTFMETMRSRFSSLGRINAVKSNETSSANLAAKEIAADFSMSVNENETFHLETNVNEKRSVTALNTKNVNLFASAFANRIGLIQKTKDITADILIVSAKNSAYYSEAKKFYRSLQDTFKTDPKRLVNCPFLDIENSACVLSECNFARLATTVQFFLQGIGLLSAMPMKTSLRKSSIASSYGRMEDADFPIAISSSSQSDSSSLPFVSSNLSIS